MSYLIATIPPITRFRTVGIKANPSKGGDAKLQGLRRMTVPRCQPVTETADKPPPDIHCDQACGGFLAFAQSIVEGGEPARLEAVSLN